MHKQIVIPSVSEGDDAYPQYLEFMTNLDGDIIASIPDSKGVHYGVIVSDAALIAAARDLEQPERGKFAVYRDRQISPHVPRLILYVGDQDDVVVMAGSNGHASDVLTKASFAKMFLVA